MSCYLTADVRSPVARHLLLLAAVWGAVAGSPARAAETESRLAAQLRPLLAAHKGRVAVAVKHLKTGETFSRDADTVMPTASLIKIAVLATAYRLADAGQLDLDRMITLTNEHKVPGSGILTNHFSAGAQLSVRDAIRLMIAFSDNTATNLVLDQIGLPTTSDTMEQLGFPNTKIHAKVYRGDTSLFPERSKQYGLGSTTAAEMIRFLEQLDARKLGSEAACETMIQHLLACEDKDLLARQLPPGTKLAHKTGAVNAVRTDAGILYSPGGPIAICVLTAENEDRRWTRENSAELLCGRVARIAYDYFNPPDVVASAGEPPILAVGASGALVEALQRTLNVRLVPSPELSADGDFGPVTREAVVRFQREQGLAATGEVGPETWKALGALLYEEGPVADPAVVNAETLPRNPPEDLTAPPLVTCKAWAIGDGTTGRLLWGRHEEERLDIASTTKIMTGYLVLRLCQQEPHVFTEEVVFSQRADDTPGSTAGLRAGETVPVQELLYGLLLPSGNDAATALGEHFGGRFAAPNGTGSAPDPLDAFVAEMNRTAEQLGMKATHYCNPHGITAEGHRSTAADLLRLAHAARQVPRFRDYVATRQHGCTVKGSSGYTRNVLWKNTNHLLAIQDYDGVKTGTTDAAGACLVSAGQRGARELIVVVLGSATSEARYVDTRNLFRWAWQQPPASE